MTQLVFNRNQFRSSPRAELEEKWNVPGHMLGVGGNWKSDLYTNVNEGDIEVFHGELKVWNGGYWTYGGGGPIVYQNGHPKKSIQLETSLQRKFPNGSAFMDVLSLDGKVFEVRLAEKENGSWQRSVMFKDTAARPNGYRPVASMSLCAECHNQAGTGLYAKGLVPGGDTILSYPFRQFE